MTHSFWNKFKLFLQEMGRSLFVLVPLLVGIVVVFILGIRKSRIKK